MMETEITAIIIDDEEGNHFLLEAFLRVVAPDVRIVGNAFSLKQVEDLIKKLSPMLLFFDIQFDGEKETAFDLLRKLSSQGKSNFQVILLTAFSREEYYAEAFDLGVLHFLTKPFDKQKLYDAVMRARKNMNQAQLPNHVLLRNSIRAPKITIEGSRFTEVVLIKDIVYLAASGRYTNVYHFSDSRPICSSVNLGEYEKKLLPFSEFFRIHRNTIVNTNFILRYSKKERSIILTPPFKTQYASKESFKEFMKQMDARDELMEPPK
ncbi:MAG: LytTR family DNA-binding domain-containing protein [Flavobacteriaceae bacterium]|nr:LytTR family DNA-binding domain-containing protein [Flavobacteriaceae bacterium]